jgi:hypothetical protein
MNEENKAQETSVAQPSLMTYNVTWGADPELFIATKDGKVVGGERAIPQDGLGDSYYDSWNQKRRMTRKRVVLDGVQVEFNVAASQCRASLGADIKATFASLKRHLDAANNGLVPSFEAVVRVDPEELKALSEAAQKLGCQPSANIHDRNASVTVTKANENLRSAGGHIHLGLHKPLMEHRERLPFLMDVIVGNTCVLIDRNPLAAERRTLYGRAGEYRIQPHGLEYRTLSNFWLRSYQLMSLVMGLSKLAASVLYTTVAEVPYRTEFKYTDADNPLSYEAVKVPLVPKYNPEDRYRKEKWCVPSTPTMRTWRGRTGRC